MIGDKIMNYLLILLLALLACSCSKSVKWVPEADSSKWVEYTTSIDKVMLTYKYPGSDGRTGFKYFKPYVDTSDLIKERHIIFVFGLYDNKQYAHYELKIIIANHIKKYNQIPGIDEFSQDYVNYFNNEDEKTRAVFDHSIVEINGTKYMNVVFYNKDGRVRADVYRTPLTKKYYLTISATYKDDLAKDPAWMASRRKIFQEFVEGVRLSERKAVSEK
jgi:hypothetical protein